ncbi:PH domain-containing protein [Streptomyces sp. NPDC058683]|uniref:PH domain-containing protein n=1 Tax=Streptomyces sp. NPDC058683 TaxID=3346597 RepID=UPI0036484D95
MIELLVRWHDACHGTGTLLVAAGAAPRESACIDPPGPASASRLHTAFQMPLDKGELRQEHGAPSATGAPGRGRAVVYDVLPREYRMTRQRMLTFLVVIAVGTLSLLGGLLTADDLSAGFTYPFAVAWLALMGWLFYSTLRCSTRVDIKAIHVRGMVRRRRLAWADIQDIKAEASLAGAVQKGAASVLVHAYGRDGSKVLLPFLDDVHVNVEYELGVLLEAWAELRGADWTPNAEAAVVIRRRESRQGALTAGAGVTGCAFIPLMGLALLPLFVDMPEWLESVLNPFAVMLLGPLLIFTLTVVVDYRKRLRDG